jgi:hypothetical protein
MPHTRARPAAPRSQAHDPTNSPIPQNYGGTRPWSPLEVQFQTARSASRYYMLDVKCADPSNDTIDEAAD